METEMISFLDGKVILRAGDCVEVLATLPECSVDSVVCDPPYHLTSIVKRFGAENASPAKVGKTGAFARASAGFMGKRWDGGDVAFQVETWAQVLRVLKPGDHLIAFSGTRTYHRMVSAIDDAGFEIRDQIGWAYGSGFPKSHNAGDGWGTALKPAWEPVVLARKPLAGTVAETVCQYGTGAINIDGCRVEASGRPAREVAALREDVIYGGNALMGRVDGSLQSSKAVGSTDLGRWPANLIHDGSEEVLAAFPADCPSGGHISHRSAPKSYGGLGCPAEERVGFPDSGSAARFFYTAKADAEDRLGSKHPTVKPLDLMQWLVRLVTPKGGVVLDPFAGTGTTGEAAWREGMRAILIEREPEYQADIARRMELAVNPTKRTAVAKTKNNLDRPEDLPLFAMESAP